MAPLTNCGRRRQMSGNNRDFWADRRVMVTGGAGFLGSRVVAELERRGAGSIFVPRSAEYDLTDRDAVLRALADARPDTVLHLAARIGGIGANRDHPAEFLYENLMMGAQIMHESWRAGVEKMTVVGTVCAYPKFTPVPFREDDIWDGYPEETNAPYGLAKKMLLSQAAAYRQQYGFNCIYLLPANLYGPGDSFDLDSSHVIPALIRKCLEAKEGGEDRLVAWGTGTPTREFLYVDDAAEGILLAMERYDKQDPVNLGSSEEVSVRELTAKIRELVGFKGDVKWDPSMPNGQPRRKLDTTLARKEFGFVARTSLDAGLRRTAEWFEQAHSRSC